MSKQTENKLRSGFTTGTAAAAAAKSALTALFSGRVPETVIIPFLSEGKVRIRVHACWLTAGTAVCTVVKDAGDDPDITHRAEIGARVTITGPTPSDGGNSVRITGGTGVGRVTKPGLEIPVGEPAINTGPRQMITAAANQVLDRFHRRDRVCVEVFVPEARNWP